MSAVGISYRCQRLIRLAQKMQTAPVATKLDAMLAADGVDNTDLEWLRRLLEAVERGDMAVISELSEPWSVP